ncbi:hypothetical protein ABW20_dc0102697 [Dactylellina cionopaga]|nr:hypothetical protein ABW20_dc0102697 [Dactylellina cionopaga]
MNQATLTDTASLTNFYRKVVHEFGHTLGCQHEQFSMNHNVRWNKEAMYAHYAQQDWSRDTVDRAYNYWQPPDPKYFVASRWDKESIMHYPIYKDWTFDNNLFCQTESSRLYRLTHLYRYKDPKILDSDWEATCIDLPLFGADAPAPETPLAAITHTYSQRLFYLDRENYIREIVWSFGKIQSKSSLGIKAATFSKLSAVRWRCDEIKDKLVEQIRVYYQLESGAIQEHSGVYTSDEKTKTGTTKWCKGKTLNFSGEVDGKALPGTDLSFVNLHVDKPAIRGYWQTTENTIREVYSDSKSWGLSHWAQFEFETPYATSLAATVWDWAGKNPKPVLYFVQTDSANDLRSIVVKTTPGNNQHKITAVGNQEVNKGSRLGIVDSDAGLHVFASNKAGIVIRKALPKKPFGSPQTLKLSWDSTLGFGPVGKW